MAVYDNGNGTSGTAKVFVSNVLSGVISRFDMTYTATQLSSTVTIIAQGFNHRTDPAALVLGPSGLAQNAYRCDEVALPLSLRFTPELFLFGANRSARCLEIKSSR